MLQVYKITTGSEATIQGAYVSDWRLLFSALFSSTTVTVTTVYANAMHHQIRQRWRATNPGSRPVNRWTRNWDTETSATTGRHVPWSFKGPAAPPVGDTAKLEALSRVIRAWS